MAVLATPVSAQCFGGGTASSFRLSATEREALRKTIDREQRKRLKLKPLPIPGTHRGTHAAGIPGTSDTPDSRNHAVFA